VGSISRQPRKAQKEDLQEKETDQIIRQKRRGAFAKKTYKKGKAKELEKKETKNRPAEELEKKEVGGKLTCAREGASIVKEGGKNEENL